jgi:hypothetical protein
VVGAKADGDETVDGRKPVARRSALDNGQEQGLAAANSKWRLEKREQEHKESKSTKDSLRAQVRVKPHGYCHTIYRHGENHSRESRHEKIVKGKW